MTQKELSAFLENTQAVNEAKSITPESVNEYVRSLERQNYALWDILYMYGLGSMAKEYISEHGNDPIPFEW